MKNLFYRSGFFLLLFLAGFHSVAAGEFFQLGFVESVSKPFNQIRLKDVVDLQKTSPNLVEKYGSLPIPSSSAELKPSEVLLALSKAGVSISQIQLVSSGQKGIPLDARSVVLHQVQDEIARAVSQENGVLSTEIELEWIDTPVSCPAPSQFQRLTLEGRAPSYQVAFINGEGQTIQRLPFQAKISIHTTVVIPKNRINAGNPVSRQDFIEEKRQLLEARDLVHSLSELKEGSFQLTQNLESGEPIKKTMFQNITAPQKGAVVNLIKKDPRFQIQTLGRIKEVLNDGTLVIVENLDSKKEVTARVLNSSEVEIVY